MPREISLAEIFQIGYYWETKILLTAVKLRVFSELTSGPESAESLAARLHWDVRCLPLLLNALVAMRVLEKVDEQYSNSQVTTRYLVQSSSEYVGHLLELHDAEWENWGKLEETIRTGVSPVTQHVFETSPEMGANVLSVLHRIGQGSGPSLAKKMNLDGAKEFLDLGGGAGTNAIAFCQEYPTLHATVFDLPTTLEVTKRTVQGAGCGSRISFIGGNFHEDTLGGPYDAVLMSDILHYQDGPSNAAVVKKVYESLSDGGCLVIKDRFLDPDRTSPAWTTAFAVHILVNTERGQCFTSGEAMEWMSQAGFDAVHELEPRAIVQGTRVGSHGGKQNG